VRPVQGCLYILALGHQISCVTFGRGDVPHAEWDTPLRILIVDDHETVRNGVRTILESRKDVEVCGEASNGQEAVEKTLYLKPDLIILDVTMPVLGGFEAARRIKASSPKLPILMLSMHEGDFVIHESQLVGVQGYVPKSHAATALLEAVDAVLRGDTFFPATSRSQNAVTPS
jgi:DNA-binding NarL/FixJ family response regulator